ncbi:hypothetical protein BU14_0384s0013 [Porphyra umbilicalis]|uniref:Uncharacterized protein n=1 Tax=Porphyra umbilicalis TaxID=2786 RepID=A0A1X6NWV1_PORUM|nr:hypothetical protein BU14_0384s0013 [Porphyra umbilicalis]|eukprot:OSX73025.1 hypothetical protein BU14_0384s0013 [Porphyra umbilicalis]
MASLTGAQTRTALGWLGRLHAAYLGGRLPPAGSVAPVGGYWHLQWRRSELSALPARLGRVAAASAAVADALYGGGLDGGGPGGAPSRWRTLLHGDAKAANLCWAPNGTSAVAALDFQYVGWGRGVMDVANLLVSSARPDVLGGDGGDGEAAAAAGAPADAEAVARWHAAEGDLLATYWRALVASAPSGGGAHTRWRRSPRSTSWRSSTWCATARRRRRWGVEAPPTLGPTRGTRSRAPPRCSTASTRWGGGGGGGSTMPPPSGGCMGTRCEATGVGEGEGGLAVPRAARRPALAETRQRRCGARQTKERAIERRAVDGGRRVVMGRWTRECRRCWRCRRRRKRARRCACRPRRERWAGVSPHPRRRRGGARGSGRAGGRPPRPSRAAAAEIPSRAAPRVAVVSSPAGRRMAKPLGDAATACAPHTAATVGGVGRTSAAPPPAPLPPTGRRGRRCGSAACDRGSPRPG